MATWARWEMGRLFFRERLCIPLCLQKPFIRKTHACLGHVGGKRLWEQMSLTTEWAQEEEARRFTMCVFRQCETCQACVRPPRLHTRFSHTPIPARIMVSVALDIFRLPLVLSRGKSFDSVAVCVWTDILVRLWQFRDSPRFWLVPSWHRSSSSGSGDLLECRRSLNVTRPVCLWVHGSDIRVQVWAFGKHFPRPTITRQMVGWDALVNH